MEHEYRWRAEWTGDTVTVFLYEPGRSTPSCRVRLFWGNSGRWQCHGISTLVDPRMESLLFLSCAGDDSPLPVINPLTAVRLLTAGKPEERRPIDAVLRHYLDWVMVSRGRKDPESIGPAEYACFRRAILALPLPRLLQVVAGVPDQILATVMCLTLDDRDQMDLFAQLLQNWHDRIKAPELVGVLTIKACKTRNLAAAHLLLRYDRFSMQHYCRHLDDELTLRRLETHPPSCWDFLCREDDLIVDLAWLGRFDLIRRCEGLVKDWLCVLLQLLLMGRWGPEVADLVSRRAPKSLQQAWHEDYPPCSWGQALATFVGPESDGEYRLMTALPAHWRELVPLAPGLIYLAVLGFAGLTGDVELAKEVIRASALSFFHESLLSYALPAFQLPVARLPELEAKVGGRWRDLMKEATRGNVDTVQYLTGCLPSDLTGVAPSDVARLLPGPRQLRSYLNEISFSPQLELEPLRRIINALVAESGQKLTLHDRWLWRASLRRLLPAELQRRGEQLLRVELAGTAMQLLGPNCLPFEALFDRD